MSLYVLEPFIHERITDDGRLTGYQVKIRRVGFPKFTKTFDSLAEARIAVTRVFADQSRGITRNTLLAERTTLGDVIRKALSDLEEGRRVVKGKDAEISRLKVFLKRDKDLCSPLGYMHPTVLYALFGPNSQWDGRPMPESRRWFTDLTELGGYFIKRCDEQQVYLTRAVEKALGVALPMAEPLYENLVSAYGTQIGDKSTLLTVLRTCKAYRSFIPMVEAPEGGLVFKKDHPILIEDVFFGLAFLVEMGRRLSVPMPTMNEIHEWSVGFLGGSQPSAVDYMPADWPGRAFRQFPAANVA